ncbi:MAG TPA: hypothetical protein VFS67_16455 [Polyangiaceae bacterium]|nr:hypothetical protein [Polyangiaceae bacterium]
MKKLVASLLLCACASGNSEPLTQNPDDAMGGTDTGNPNDGRGNETGGSCDEAARALDPDELTAIGVSAGELFSWVGGTHEQTLAWQDSAASFGPEHGRSAITIEIEPLGARFIDRSPKQSGGGEGLAIAEIGWIGGDPCGDSIALDVRVHLSTAGGALDETVETTLQARARDYATGQLSLPIDMLAGSFEAQVPVPAGSVPRGAPRLLLDLGLSQYGDRGQLQLLSEFQSSDGQSVGQGAVGVVARFPADDTCQSGIGVAADQSVRGLSLAAVLERLNGSSPARLDGSSATLDLAFTSSAARVCVALDGPESGSMRIEVPGQAQLHSSDQRIDGTIDVTISGDATGGVLERSAASANDFLLDPAQAQAKVARYALVQPLDFSSYDGGAFEFLAEVSDGSAGGALRAYGLRLPDCLKNPPAPVPGAQSSPGCPGADRLPLWSATWSKP